MTKGRKIAVGVSACFFAVFILLFAAIFIAPKLVNLDTVKDRLRSEMTKAIGGEFDFGRIELALLPGTHLYLYDATWVHPKRLVASVKDIKVTFALLPLLTGNLKINELLIQRPELTITRVKPTEKEKSPAGPHEIGGLVNSITTALAALPEFKIPDVNSQIVDGRMKLIYGDSNILELHDIEAHITSVSDKVTFQITGASPLAKSLSITGGFNPGQMKGNARIELAELQPQLVYHSLLPDAPLKVETGPADLTIDFHLDGSSQMQADMNFSMPRMTLGYENNRVEIKSRGLQCGFQYDKKSATLSLTKLDLDYPRMTLTGDIVSSIDDEHMQVRLEGRDIDLITTREVAMALLGKNPVVRDIFGIVKGGNLPVITLETEGHSLSDLGDMDNLVIRGRMQKGDITIPGVGLNVEKAAGDVVISQGVLEGENLQANLGNSFGKKGRIKLGLMGDRAPLDLEVNLQADVSQLPSILKDLIKDRSFQKELNLVEELHGSVVGKLVLGGDTENIKVRVEASDMHLGARYRKMPFPLELTGGDLTYEGSRIEIKQLSGTLGKSSFSGFTAGLDLGKARYLEVTSGQSRIYFPELLPWASSHGAIRKYEKYYGGGKSIITLSGLNLKGPLLHPKKWDFKAAGDLEDFELKNLPKNPGPLTVASVTFKVDPQVLSYTDAQLRILDTAWKISGRNKGYIKSIDGDVTLVIEGRVGPKSIQWASKVLHVPSRIKLRPLKISPSHIRFTQKGKKTLLASLALQEGLEITTDVQVGADELTIKNLFLQDKASRANIGLHYRNRAFDLSFNGNLHQSTLDRLTRENDILMGSITGDIQAHVNVKDLSHLRLRGKLKGREIVVPLNLKTPLKIDTLSVKGVEQGVVIESADLAWGDLGLKMSGSLKPMPQKHLWLDLDITADSVDVEPLIQELKVKSRRTNRQAPPKSSALPVQGNIRFMADRFTVKKFLWNPFHADISLKDDRADITLKKALLCGISTLGTLTWSPQTVRVDIQTAAEDQALDTTLNCLSSKTFKADGSYSLKGQFQGRGKAKDLIKASMGQAELTVSDGRIYHDIVMLNVLKFLNFTEVLTGQISEKDMKEKGFGYKALHIKADLKDGKLLYKEMVLDGNSMTVIGQGEHDLILGQLDVNFLVAPQATLDSILGHIPLVGGILRTLETIPLSITGPYDDIHIRPLSPSSIGFELKELMGNTIGIPFKVKNLGESPVSGKKTNP